jgi:VWFA-related protein
MYALHTRGPDCNEFQTIKQHRTMVDASLWEVTSMRARRKMGRFPSPVKGAVAILLLASSAGVRAQQQQGHKISVKTNVVTLFATVHDADGRVVKNLKADDFVLLEDGSPQRIEFFSQESDLPLTIGLLVDTSRSQTGVLEEERRASYTFLDQVLRESDEAFVVHFDIEVEILQRPTSSRSDLESALARLRIPQRDTTLIYSAVKEASEDPMYQLMGRKAFILLTDGVPFHEPLSLTTAIEFAQRADVIIYAIRFADPVPLSHPIIGPILALASEHGKQGLHRMVRETGGAYYEVTGGKTIEEIYQEIEEALRNQYGIGYTPPRSAPDGKYHKIKLTTKDRHLSVNSRAGYYAK